MQLPIDVGNIMLPCKTAEAPALEEILRVGGFGSNEADVCHNPTFVPQDDESSRLAHNTSGIMPASAARHISVRPNRSSFRETSRQAKNSMFQSTANTAMLTAGMVRRSFLLHLCLPWQQMSRINWCRMWLVGCIQALEGSHYLCYANDHAKHSIYLSQAER